MKIVADTATLFSPEQGKELGLNVIPVCVAIDGETYRDYVDISTEELLAKVAAGGVPSSSQPAVGDMLEVLEADEEETLVLTVGDGLSGAYRTALAACNCVENGARVHVVNSGTLAGPLRYMAKKALAMREQGMDMERIKAELARCVESSMSFVVPEDFDFLRRSGRLTAITARIGGALKLLPVLTQTEDRARITPVTIKRSWKSAVEVILQRLQAAGVDEKYLISICHGCAAQRAAEVLEQVKQKLHDVETELLELSPALITHGGPGCIVIQAVLK